VQSCIKWAKVSVISSYVGFSTTAVLFETHCLTAWTDVILSMMSCAVHGKYMQDNVKKSAIGRTLLASWQGNATVLHCNSSVLLHYVRPMIKYGTIILRYIGKFNQSFIFSEPCRDLATWNEYESCVLKWFQPNAKSTTSWKSYLKSTK
jgi:hypothetical protein